MQPLGTKKITQALVILKIAQPLVTKKNHATQPLNQEKLYNLLGQKKIHLTSQDKKACNLSGQRIITQPLRTTKKHATSQDKKK